LVLETEVLYFSVSDEDSEDVHFMWIYRVEGENGLDVPSFITKDIEAMKVTIAPISEFQQGFYDILVRIEDTDSVSEGITKTHENYFTVEVIYVAPDVEVVEGDDGADEEDGDEGASEDSSG